MKQFSLHPINSIINGRKTRLNSQKGFTLSELLVASALALSIMAAALTTTVLNKRVLNRDIAKTSLNQELRSAIDIISFDVRAAGERAGIAFPAIEIINGPDGAPDSLVIRRLITSTTLSLCADILSGASPSLINFSSSPLGEVEVMGPLGPEIRSFPECVYDAGSATAMLNWQDAQINRINNFGSAARVFLYNSSSRKYMWLDYVAMTEVANSRLIEVTPTTFADNFPAISSTAALVEEVHYKLVNGLLQIVTNGEINLEPLNVASGMTDFQATAILRNGSERESFAANESWTQLRSIRVSLSGQGRSGGKIIDKSVSSEFMPRNIASLRGFSSSLNP